MKTRMKYEYSRMLFLIASVLIFLIVMLGLTACGVSGGRNAGTPLNQSGSGQKKTEADQTPAAADSTQKKDKASPQSQQNPSTQSSKNPIQSGEKKSTSSNPPITQSANSTQTANNGNTVQAPQGLIPVVVAKNVDGDTIHVTMPSGKEEDVRMLLIDTPEDVSPSKPVEPYGYTAANYAKSVLKVGEKIYIEEGVKGSTRDKYGRLLAFIYRTPTDMYNLDVLKKGYARVAYIYPPNTQHLTALKNAEAYAKSKKLGIWSISGYVTSSGYNLSIACHYAETNHYTTHGCSSGTSVSTTPSTASSTTSSKTETSTVSGNTNTGERLLVHPGEEATVSVKTTPNTEGSIEVDYKSGPSHAKGLDPKKSDGNGNLSWSWYVGTNTTPGTYKVILTIGSNTITKQLVVTK